MIRGWRSAALGVAALVTTVACYPGAYPIDIFIEMHYQPSQRRLEPNRLAAPADSVPMSGRAPVHTIAEARDLASPLQRDQAGTARAQRLYATNCALCHGADGRGKSVTGEHFARSKIVTPPVDLAGERVSQRTDGELYWFISNGIGAMPHFRSLLTEQERWLLVDFIRQTQGR